jgi:hypothetical protein
MQYSANPMYPPKQIMDEPVYLISITAYLVADDVSGQQESSSSICGTL